MILRVNYFDGNTPIAKFASGCEQSQLRYRDYMYYDRAYNDGYGPYVAASNAAAASVQPLKFGGKEVERHGGLGWHDFEARWLSNGRFTTQDPKRESYYPLSPYAWCAGTPLRNIDPTGREVLNHFHQTDQRKYNWAKKYKDDNAIHVFAHETSDSKALVLNYNKVGDPITVVKSASQFKSIVLSHSKIWKLSRQSGKPVVIILHSCLTGNNVSSFAYKLSKDEELKTMTIIAPTKEIGVDKSYKSEVRTLVYDNNGKPLEIEKGRWLLIRDGKVFDSFGSTWEAKENPSFWDKLFK